MKFCQKHWDALRHAIQSRGGSDFIARNGAEAAKNMAAELNGYTPTKRTYDPLMSAHWMIVNNAMDMLKSIGANPIMLMCPPEDHPEFSCPICCLNFLSAEHDRTCTDPTCQKVKGQTFDDWIEHASKAAIDHIATLPE